MGLLNMFSENKKAVESKFMDHSQSSTSEVAENSQHKSLDVKPVQSDFFVNYNETKIHQSQSDSDDSFSKPFISYIQLKIHNI